MSKIASHFVTTRPFLSRRSPVANVQCARFADEVGESAWQVLTNLWARRVGRFDGIERGYAIDEVLRLRGSVAIEHTVARRGALKLWELLHEEDPIRALGAVTGNQAMQMVRAGLKAIYLSGWQVAADSNTAGAMYPDQSLYPAKPGPELARKINRTLQRADQIEHLEGGAEARLVRADRRRCRSRLWRPAELLRDHEGLYRGRRRGRSLRGPARVGEKVRAPRRQGPDPDRGRTSAISTPRAWLRT